MDDFLNELDFTLSCEAPHAQEVAAVQVFHTSFCPCVRFLCSKHAEIVLEQFQALAMTPGLLIKSCRTCGATTTETILAWVEPLNPLES